MTTAAKTILNAVHHRAVHNRRVRVLSDRLAQIIPGAGRVLDLGCGDGLISRMLMERRPDLEIEGVDVLIRPQTLIPVTQFDGSVLPFEAGSVDYVTIVDVLHHTKDPAAVLKEARRVARKGVIIKDHLLEGIGAGATLRLMDWVGNRGHDVVLPFNYLTRARWVDALRLANLRVVTCKDSLGLYPLLARPIFERHLHFLALTASVSPKERTA
jgi:ubiquinone/menaquinone biosynthesis C-methylase UbiE